MTTLQDHPEWAPPQASGAATWKRHRGICMHAFCWRQHSRFQKSGPDSDLIRFIGAGLCARHMRRFLAQPPVIAERAAQRTKLRTLFPHADASILEDHVDYELSHAVWQFYSPAADSWHLEHLITPVCERLKDERWVRV